MMHLDVGAATDVGRVRSLNEDNFMTESDVVAVADGMGGHRSGEVASEHALAVFRQSLAERSLDSLLFSVKAANAAVLRRASDNAEHKGMGTTLCALGRLSDSTVGIVNVGDSRVYVLSVGVLVQISEDHSFVEGLVRDGRLTRAQADVHPQRNVLTRALGIEPDVAVDGWTMDVTSGDRFLLCSDGLFNEVSDATIQGVLAGAVAPQDAADELVRLALDGGGRDNVTVVVADVVTDLLDARDPLDRLNRATPDDSDATVLGGIAPIAAPAAVAPTSGPASPRRRFNWRAAAFVVAFVAIIGVAVGAVYWYARNTFVVGAQDGQVVIFEGRPEGVLWVEPEVLRQPIAVSDITDESKRVAVQAGVELKSLAEAQSYVDNLTPTTTTTTTIPTTTTTTTTTTVPPVTVVPTDPAAVSPPGA